MEERSYRDAKTARDRAIEAMVSAEDVATRASLWRAALKFHGRMKLAGSALTYAPRRSPAQGGLVSAGEM